MPCLTFIPEHSPAEMHTKTTFWTHVMMDVYLETLFRGHEPIDVYIKPPFRIHGRMDAYPNTPFGTHITKNMYPKMQFWVHKSRNMYMKTPIRGYDRTDDYEVKMTLNGMVLDDNLMLAMRKISDETLATSGVRLA